MFYSVYMYVNELQMANIRYSKFIISEKVMNLCCIVKREWFCIHITANMPKSKWLNFPTCMVCLLFPIVKVQYGLNHKLYIIMILFELSQFSMFCYRWRVFFTYSCYQRNRGAIYTCVNWPDKTNRYLLLQNGRNCNDAHHFLTEL